MVPAIWPLSGRSAELGIHGRLARMYSERRHGYVTFCGLVVVAGIMLALTPVATAVTARYEGLAAREWAVSIGIAEPLIAISAAVAVLASRSQLRLVGRWAAGQRDGLSAQAVATAVHELPRRLFVVTAAMAFVTAMPAGVATTLEQKDELDFSNFVVLDLAGFFFSAWGIVLIWVWAEVCIRPLLIEIARIDPTVDVSGPGRLSTTGKLVIALSSAMVVAACYSGSLTADPGEPISSLLRLIAVTAAVTAVFAVLLVPLFSTMLLQPIRDLTRATRGVTAGDLALRVPVINRDEVGELEVSLNELVDGLRERAELRVDNARLVVELRASRERLVRAGDAARRKVERDLHDGAQQQMATVGLKLRLLQDKLGTEHRGLDLVAELRVDVETAVRELRDLAHGVYPAQLDDGGLAAAIDYALDRSGRPFNFDCQTERRYRQELEVALYFSCVEALQNVTKHAGDAATVRVYLAERDGSVVLEVADDGIGYAADARAGRSGLQNIADRVGALGGTLTVDSAMGRGVSLRASVPCAAQPERGPFVGSTA